MVKNNKKTNNKNIFQLILFNTVVLFILLVVFWVIYYFTIGNTSIYRIENKHYGFELKTPKNWIAKANVFYQQEDIDRFIEECENNKTESIQEISAFRFQDQKYQEDIIVQSNSLEKIPTTGILEITINCVPKNQVVDYSFADIKIGGENAFSVVYNAVGLIKKTKSFSFLHNGLQYNINEYIYLSESEKENNNKISEKYESVFNKIISSFKFIK